MFKTFTDIEVAAQSQDFGGFLYWVPDACKAKVKTEKTLQQKKSLNRWA